MYAWYIVYIYMRLMSHQLTSPDMHMEISEMWQIKILMVNSLMPALRSWFCQNLIIRHCAHSHPHYLCFVFHLYIYGWVVVVVADRIRIAVQWNVNAIMTGHVDYVRYGNAFSRKSDSRMDNACVWRHVDIYIYIYVLSIGYNWWVGCEVCRRIGKYKASIYSMPCGSIGMLIKAVFGMAQMCFLLYAKFFPVLQFQIDRKSVESVWN